MNLQPSVTGLQNSMPKYGIGNLKKNSPKANAAISQTCASGRSKNSATKGKD
jgi:hypothetical protein